MQHGVVRSPPARVRDCAGYTGGVGRADHDPRGELAAMTNTRLVAYALIAIGIVALLSRLTPDAGWLWIGLVAAGFLFAYQREHVYPFLVVGSILMGVAVGILLEGNWHWPGAFLVSLGAGVGAIDLAAPRPNRWPRVAGLGLIALGVVTGLAEAGVLTSSAFAVLLIAAGLVLVLLPRRTPADRETAAAGGATAGATGGAGGAAASPPAARAPAPSTPLGPGRTASAGTAAAPEPARPAEATGPRAALLAWRRETARAEGRSEAMVLRDDTLEAVLAAGPASLEELAAVKGVGPVTIDRYGRAILARLTKA